MREHVTQARGQLGGIGGLGLWILDEGIVEAEERAHRATLWRVEAGQRDEASVAARVGAVVGIEALGLLGCVHEPLE